MNTPVLTFGDQPQSFAWGHLLSFPKKRGGTGGPRNSSVSLVKHLALNDESQLRYFSEAGMLPVTNNAIALLQGDPYVVAWTLASSHSAPDEVSQWTASTEPVDIIGDEVKEAITGTKSVSQALVSMEKRLLIKMPQVVFG